MKRLLLLIFLISQGLFAQDYSNSWNDHFSYYNIQSIDYTESKIYAAAENSVFIHDLNLNSNETISSVNGLSGERISTIYFSEEHQKLLIGYENGLIEIKSSAEESIFRVTDIVEKQTIAPTDKVINQFLESNGKIFIATGYGVSEYDLENLEFGDSFYIGSNGIQLAVSQIAVLNGNIYAATMGGGIKYAEVDNPNLVDFNQWQTISSDSWKGITTVNETLYAIKGNNALYRIENSNLVTVATGLGLVKDLGNYENNIIVTSADKVSIFDQNGNQINSFTSLPDGENLTLNTAFYNGEHFFLGHSMLGLLMTNPSSGSYQVLSPQGPLFNMISNIEATENQLWVVFDEYDTDYNPYPISSKGASHFVGNDWHNFSSEFLFGVPEFVNITINPNSPNEVYLSSYFKGLLKVVDEEPQILYNETNGLDDVVIPSNPSYVGDVRINGGAFDAQGNLWFVNSMVDEGLKVLTPQGNIQGVDITSVVPNPASDNGFEDLVIDQNNNIYFGTEKNGVIAYQYSTGNLEIIVGNASGANLPSNEIRGMAVDQNNVLWIGTNRGLRVLYNPSSVFTQNVATSPIIIVEDDGVAQELLFEQFISDIEVDGANNKWIATATSGVFYVSSNGQDIIGHYTTDNSPLPSDNVTDVGIDHSSGRVYFGTINGLVSFKGTATQARNNLNNVFAYPNPVRPGFQGNVVIDGLMQDANVKITDISGNLVYEEVAQGGSILWDTTAFGKYKVASGVYLVIITSEDQAETKVTKIMVVR